LAKAHLRFADGKPIALDEDGTLALTRDTSQGFDVLSRVALLKKIAWTPMTRAGTKLCVRDHASLPRRIVTGSRDRRAWAILPSHQGCDPHPARLRRAEAQLSSSERDDVVGFQTCTHQT
jgi:hypothetical protein